MRGTPRVIEAKATEACRIWVRFEDRLAAEVDLSCLLEHAGVCLPLRDPEFFRKVSIYPEGNTICWPGEVDIAPETLYLWTQEAAGVAA